MGKAHYTELPPWERAAYYRQMARETEALGENGSAEFRKNCREFAARWRKLANELMTRSFVDFDHEAEADAAGTRSRPSDNRNASRPQNRN
jgi:hypothetical protein